MQVTLYPSPISGASNLHILDLNTIPTCSTLLNHNAHCITIGYAPENETTHAVMKILADQHHLSISSEPNSTASDLDVVGFADFSAIQTYAEAYPNTTQACKYDSFRLLCLINANTVVLFHSPTNYAVITQGGWTDFFYGRYIDDADISLQIQVALDQAICKFSVTGYPGISIA